MTSFRQIEANRRNARKSTGPSGPELVDPAVHFASCFLRLANLPSYALDRLSGYEAILWRQVSQILFALDALERRKPHERQRRLSLGSGQEPPFSEPEDG